MAQALLRHALTERHRKVIALGWSSATQRLDEFVRAKAGTAGRILVRGDLNFNSSTSRYADLVARNANSGKVKFRRRHTTGGDTLSTGPSEGTTHPQTIAMPADTLVGLVALRNGSTAGAMTATFTNVNVVP